MHPPDASGMRPQDASRGSRIGVQEMKVKRKRRDKTEAQLAILELRKHRGLTQQQLAVHMGVTLTSVNRWETRRPPRGYFLMRLASVAMDFERKDLAEIFLAGADKELAAIGELSGLPDSGEVLQSALRHLEVITDA